jgi:hypothetical protein
VKERVIAIAPRERLVADVHVRIGDVLGTRLRFVLLVIHIRVPHSESKTRNSDEDEDVLPTLAGSRGCLQALQIVSLVVIEVVGAVEATGGSTSLKGEVLNV